MDEIEALRKELEHYKAEKEKIRTVVGQIGGATKRHRNTMINIFFLAIVMLAFFLDLLRHLLKWNLPYLPPTLILEIAVLLVSLKIIWMMHNQAKVYHFQFWILNSIEFQLNMLSRRLSGLNEHVERLATKNDLTDASPDSPQVDTNPTQENPTK